MPLPILSPNDVPDILGGGPSSVAFGRQFVNVAQSPLSSIIDDPRFAQVRGLLQPGAGGLSPNLDRLLELGLQRIRQGTAGNVAEARTQALGRGLEGSTIEAAGVTCAPPPG